MQTWPTALLSLILLIINNISFFDAHTHAHAHTHAILLSNKYLPKQMTAHTDYCIFCGIQTDIALKHSLIFLFFLSRAWRSWWLRRTRLFPCPAHPSNIHMFKILQIFLRFKINNKIFQHINTIQLWNNLHS